MRPHVSFPRVVLCRKCRASTPDSPVFASAQLSTQLVSEVFGPADRYRQTERWAFVDHDGNVSCAIIAHVGKAKPSKSVRVDFVAPAKLGRAFFEWTTTKINLTENGDLAPAFLMPSR